MDDDKQWNQRAVNAASGTTATTRWGKTNHDKSVSSAKCLSENSQDSPVWKNGTVSTVSSFSGEVDWLQISDQLLVQQ
jgi:hypothetical protein